MQGNILFLGDSHIGYFRRAVQELGFLPRQDQFCEVGGATAVGMRNPNSATNALQIFRGFLQHKSRQATVVLQLGEVDCGFVIWYRAKKYNEAIQDQLRESIAAYLAFVFELQYAGFQNIVITGATLPTIRDGQDWGDVANKRRDVTASLKQRTRLTLDYNEVLRSKSRDFGLHYLDITADIIDPVTGTVRHDYLNPDPRDHHLDYGAAGRLWADKLCGLITSQGWDLAYPAA
jgi:hypothetical protein